MAEITPQGIIDEALSIGDAVNGCSFPVNIIPKQLQQIIRETHRSLNYPIDYIAVSLCFAISITIGNTYVIKVKDGWIERAILYVALLGRPGTNKSHPLSFALQPLFDYDREEYSKFKKAMTEYNDILSLNRKEREERGIVSLPSEPIQKKFIVSDITPECLAFIHENNRRGICLYTDELASWFKNFNRYTKGSEEQFWLSLFSGKPIIYDRRGGKNSVSINHSFIGVIGTIQQGILKELAKGDRNHNGFIDRILFVIPENLKKTYWTENNLPSGIQELWKVLIDKLIRTEYRMDEFGDPIPKVLTLDCEAKVLLYNWQRENTDRCNMEINEIMIGVYSKMEIYVIRFCLILQIARYLCGESGNELIDAESVRGAIALSGYFQNTAQRVQEILTISSRLEQMPTDKVKLYNSLPSDFSTGEGIKIATRFDMSEDSFKRFLNDVKGNLLDNYKHGRYRKK